MGKKYFLMAVALGFVNVMCGAELPPEARRAAREETVESTVRPASEDGDGTMRSWRSLDRWSFQAGIGWISGSTIDEIMAFEGEQAKGDARGEIYLLQVSYKAAEFHPTVFDHRLDLDLEVPFVLGVVDERKGDPFMQYNAGVTLRWKSFPWNRWLYTNLETGCGLTYSSHVLETERARHPTRERSHLEFYWPIQLMVAHPGYREHQFVMFLHHHSGGAIFHKGGANTLGIGYRFVPGER